MIVTVQVRVYEVPASGSPGLVTTTDGVKSATVEGIVGGLARKTTMLLADRFGPCLGGSTLASSPIHKTIYILVTVSQLFMYLVLRTTANNV